MPLLLEGLRDWLSKSQNLSQRFRFTLGASNRDGDSFWIDVSSPYSGRVRFVLLKKGEIICSDANLSYLVSGEEADLVVIVLCLDEADPQTQPLVERLLVDPFASSSRDSLLFIEPSWAAAVLIEQMKPIFAGAIARRSASAAYFEPAKEGGNIVSIRRFGNRMQAVLGTVIDDPGDLDRRWRALQKEENFPGPILLCTTFLPPVTHSFSAIERFYKASDLSEVTVESLAAKHQWEKDSWIEHIRNYRRVDILDRSLVEEYLAVPEYYQMLLTPEELQEQVETLIQLLGNDNYTLCLTPESVDITYEIRGSEVRIRTDRRNKGEPRSGRISGLVLQDPQMSAVFEREFWNMFRLTEAKFKTKDDIVAWIRKKAEQYTGHSDHSSVYDSLLLYNTADRVDVGSIREALKAKGVRLWWNSMPGRPWRRTLEMEIENIRSVTLFMGRDGLAPWYNWELEYILRKLTSRSIPVVLVRLFDGGPRPEIPFYLRAASIVDLSLDRSATGGLADLLRTLGR